MLLFCWPSLFLFMLLLRATVVIELLFSASTVVIVQTTKTPKRPAIINQNALFAFFFAQVLRFFFDFQDDSKRFWDDSKRLLRRFQATLSVWSIEIKGKQSGLPPAGLTLGDWSQVLAYCCSRGLLFTSVVHQAHCCSVVTVNNKNIVQKLTFGNPVDAPRSSVG